MISNESQLYRFSVGHHHKAIQGINHGKKYRKRRGNRITENRDKEYLPQIR